VRQQPADQSTLSEPVARQLLGYVGLIVLAADDIAVTGLNIALRQLGGRSARSRASH
jgi:hypothetical protein